MTGLRQVLTRGVVIPAFLLLLGLGPAVLSLTSPLLAWRDPVYVIGGFAGVLSLSLLLLQPFLARGWLPSIPMAQSRKFHKWIGLALVAAVIIHIGGLWITSPPDVVDVLLFRSPTPFAIWGALAMWGVFMAAGLAAFRRKLAWRPIVWRRVHRVLVALVLLGTVTHAILIEGTMETLTKTALCLVMLIAGALAISGVKPGAIFSVFRRTN